MCSRLHPDADCLCDAARLEVIDPIADAMDAKRHARERAERAAAGIPEPTIAELAKGFAPVCGHDGDRVEGGLCVGCAKWRAGGVA